MSIYQSLYNLINTYIFNGGIVEGTTQALVTELIATGGAIFLVALPFVVVIKVIGMITGK